MSAISEDRIIRRIEECASELAAELDQDGEAADIRTRLRAVQTAPAGTYRADLVAVLSWAEYRLDICKAYA